MPIPSQDDDHVFPCWIMRPEDVCRIFPLTFAARRVAFAATPRYAACVPAGASRATMLAPASLLAEQSPDSGT
jgi:hypothetical protein